MGRFGAGWKPAPTLIRALLMLVVAAAAVSVSGVEASTGQPSSISGSRPQEPAAPDADALRRGQQIVDSACSICHELDLVESERLSREDWGYIIQAMLVNGSDLSEREMPLVLDYLSTAFPAGPGAALEEN